MEKTQPVQKPLLLAIFFLLSSVCFSQVTQQWGARYNGPANSFDGATGIAVDAAGNVYVTGSSRVGETNADYATIKYDAKGNQLWLKTYNGTGNGSDGANAIAIDAKGNVYVTGQSEGSGFFNFDYVTIKYDTKGNQLWVSRYDGPGIATDIVSAIAVDAAGNAYITGSSYGSSSNTDYATIKYDSDGNLKWVSRYDGSGNGNDGANALALDDNGNVYVTGYSTGSGTAEDYATIKYNTNGGVQWVSRYNGPANSLEQAFSLALDLFGNVYVTGQSFEAAAGSAYATIKYNTSGVQQWVSRYHPGVGSDVAKAVVTDAAGNVYVTGHIAVNTSDFAGDYATIKYNTNGVQQWVAIYNGPDDDIDQATALAVDASSNVYVTGFSSFKNEILTESDYTTIKYNTNGVQQWLARYGGPGNSSDIPTALAVDVTGNVYVTGFSYGNGSDFDYATIKYAQSSGCGNKVVMCHSGKTLCIDITAVPNHLKHGDQMGACIAPQVTAATTNTDDVRQNTDAAGNLKIFHFPDPVSSITKMQYEVPFDGQVSIRMYDILGRQVGIVAEGGRKAGYYTVVFDASTLQKGIYYYRMTLKTEKKMFLQTQKMTVVR
jgi:uncharacterized delta-60 repeat protein